MLVSKLLCLMFETKHSSILLLRILKKYLFKLISRDNRENLSKLSLYFCFGKMHVQSQQQTRRTSACVPSVVPELLIFSWSLATGFIVDLQDVFVHWEKNKFKDNSLCLGVNIVDFDPV